MQAAIRDLSPSTSSGSTPSRVANNSPELSTTSPPSETTVAFVKGPKRKRLAKACDACHKSKRRCDGTAPCGNCYYASKTCTYTDSSGRLVPAPRDRVSPKGRSKKQGVAVDPQFATSPRLSQAQQVVDEDGQDPTHRKRIRTSPQMEPDVVFDQVSLTPAPASLFSAFDRPLMFDRPPDLDHALTLEFVNLFFTHCHPYRLFIHRPSFLTALSHNAIPNYLMYAIFALAAPLSKQPRIRTSPSRLAGRDFAQESTSLMFDGAGRLICPANLMTAQALCLLRVHDFRLKAVNSRNHELAYRIIQSLGLANEPDPNIEETLQMAIDRECSRRIIWNIYCTNLSDMIYFRAPASPKVVDLPQRLPMDETSFEFFASPNLPPPEQLEMSPNSRYRSEFGHFIRISRIANRIEHLLNPLTGKEPVANPLATLVECEQDIALWEAGLPERLRYDEETFHVQSSMFETNANTAAWCYFGMHVYHASCALALNCARQHHQKGPKSEPRWALSRFEKISEALAAKGKNTYLLPSIIWALRRYCGRNDAQIQQWVDEVEDFWGVNVLEQADNVGICPPPLGMMTALSISNQAQPVILDNTLYSFGRSHIPHPRFVSQSPPQQQQEIERTAALSSSAPTNSLRDFAIDGGRRTGCFIDPSLQPSGPRNKSVNGAGCPTTNGEIPVTPRSLPSLKSSGLLDSWNTSHAHGVHHYPIAQHHPMVGGVPTTTMPSGGRSMAEGDPSRSANLSTSGMPVGMPWLANEAR